MPPTATPPASQLSPSAIVRRTWLPAVALAAAALMAVQEQSASRMLIWPWQLLYWGGAFAAGLGLIHSLLAPPHQITALERPWAWALGAAALALVLSTTASPFRDQILPWVAWPLATLAVVAAAARAFGAAESGLPLRRVCLVALGVIGVALSFTSLTMLASDLAASLSLREGTPFAGGSLWAGYLGSRNTQPLGHANYTAGSALLFLPILIGLAWSSRGWMRLAWSIGTTACLAMFFSGGSRGALIGLAAMIGLGVVLIWRSGRVKKLPILLAAALLLGAGWLHPSIRGRLLPPPPDAPVNVSNEQRKTWVYGGLMATADRPLLGWGHGASPWLFPKYRGHFDYGPYTMLQLHSLPIEVLASGGLASGLAVAALASLGLRSIGRRARNFGARTRLREDDATFWPAAFSLLGYGVFATTDYQLDLPLIGVVVALLLAILAAPESPPRAQTAVADIDHTSTGAKMPRRLAVGAVGLALCGLIVVGRQQLMLREAMERDDWPAAARIAPNDAALRHYVADRLLRAEAASPAEQAGFIGEALRLLGLNASQGFFPDLTHTRLGWLHLGPDPRRAHDHFSAALKHAPNLLSALLGAGLASAKAGDTDQAILELSAACLAHPRFISSGWWCTPALSALRPEVIRQLDAQLAFIAASARARSDERAHAEYLGNLIAWIEGDSSALQRLAHSASSRHQSFWIALLHPEDATPEGLPDGLEAALLASQGTAHQTPRWISVLELQRGQPIWGGFKSERELARKTPPAELVRSVLHPVKDSPWPLYRKSLVRVGFPINHRHPRLQGIVDGMDRIENVWNGELLGDLWPDENWIPHYFLTASASAETSR